MGKRKKEKKGLSKPTRIFLISAIVIFTIYAPVELSRLIIEYGLGETTMYMTELLVMWSGYLLAMYFIYKLVK